MTAHRRHLAVPRWLVALVVVATVSMITACGKGGGTGAGQGADKRVVAEKATAPDNARHSNLDNHLATGSGAADIEAVDEGFVAHLKARPEQFANVLDLGAGALENNYLPFRWQRSLSRDGHTAASPPACISRPSCCSSGSGSSPSSTPDPSRSPTATS